MSDEMRGLEDRLAFEESLIGGEPSIGLASSSGPVMMPLGTPISEPMPAASDDSRVRADLPENRWIGKTLSHFRIMRLLGQGTMGVVFQVEDVMLKRIAALKVLRRRIKGTDKAPQVDRFLLEARAAAGIDHPNIAQVYEINEYEGWWYIAMEFLEGSSLQHLLSTTGPLPAGKAALMIADAARGLAAAHDAGMIHRDIKPANLMLTRRGRCKVVDFGLVKLDSADNPFRDDHQILGTPYYMAPEIILHKGAVAGSDVYSLGATLFALITGRAPFLGADVKEVMRHHVETPAPDVRAQVPGVSPGLAALIQRTMEKDALRRPTAEAFAAVLQTEIAQALANETPSVSAFGSPMGATPLPGAGGASGASASALPSLSSAENPGRTMLMPGSRRRRVALPALLVAAGSLVVGLALWKPWNAASSASRTPGVKSAPVFEINSLGMRLIRLTPGSFVMGSAPGERGRMSDERAVEVSITARIAMSETEVTQAQWAVLMGDRYAPPDGIHPNDASGKRFIGDDFPAYVSWHEASEFCRLLSLKEGAHYRLPTEAEWEYACRAGTTSAYSFGDGLDPSQANIDVEGIEAGIRPAGRPMPVASFPANSWGFHDMHGNVMEWCADWKGERPLGPLRDPSGPESGAVRVIRGGSWDTYAEFARSANRWANYPVLRTDYVGFRVVRDDSSPMPEPSAPLASNAPGATESRVGVPAPPIDTADVIPIDVDALLASYEPRHTIEGRLRSVGSDTMDRLMVAWVERFQGWHASVRLRHEGKGSGTAVPALLEGFAHLGPMSRALSESETRDFLSEHGYEPVQLIVGVDALAVFVHASNPVSTRGMTLAELRSIFGDARGDPAAGAVDRWVAFVDSDPWRDAPIRLFGRNPASGTYSVFKHEVLKDGVFRPGMLELVGSAEVVDRVAANPFGIGFSGIGYLRHDVATVALARDQASPRVHPTPESAHDGTYPLVRPLYVTVDVPPAETIPTILQEFVRFMYSREGQHIVALAGYYPLSASQAEEQLRRVGLSTVNPR